MITAFIKGQDLKVLTPIIASDSVNYLELTVHFQTSDWKDLDEIYAIFEKDGAEPYELPLIDGRITKEAGINLTEGTYKLHFVGFKNVDGEPVERITTVQQVLTVLKSGVIKGGAFPSLPVNEKQKIWEAIGELDNLNTMDKSSLVNAINEVLLNGKKEIEWFGIADEENMKATHTASEIISMLQEGKFVIASIDIDDGNVVATLIAIPFAFNTGNVVAFWGLFGTEIFIATVDDEGNILTDIISPMTNAVKTVNNISPDTEGNVIITYEDIGAASSVEFEELKRIVGMQNEKLQKTLEGVEQ